MKNSFQSQRLLPSLILAALALLTGCAAPAPSHSSSPEPSPATLRVNVFPGSSNLPLLVAVQKGFMAKRGITVEIQNTPNSEEQRAGLAAAKFEIAMAAVDNALAMVEVAKLDVVIVSGGDGGMNEVMVRKDINSLQDVRGKSLAVDAPNTAYALAAKKILKDNGLLEGRDYKVVAVGGTGPRTNAMVANPELVIGIANPPFSITTRERGLKSLGTQYSFIGDYQAQGAFVMRDWAKRNPELLERYLAAVIEGYRYAMQPSHQAEMVAILATRFQLTPAVAEAAYKMLMSPGGLSVDGRMNMAGFRRVLALRAEMEGLWGGKAPEPDRYLDLSYYDRAIKQAR